MVDDIVLGGGSAHPYQITLQALRPEALVVGTDTVRQNTDIIYPVPFGKLLKILADRVVAATEIGVNQILNHLHVAGIAQLIHLHPNAVLHPVVKNAERIRLLCFGNPPAIFHDVKQLVIARLITLADMLFYLQHSFLGTVQLVRVELLRMCISTGNQRIRFLRREVGKQALYESCRFLFGNAVTVVFARQMMQVIVAVSFGVFFRLVVIVVQGHH